MLVSLSPQTKSQDVGIGTSSPNSQAILHIDVGASTTKGQSTMASGDHSVALGLNSIASGSYSFAVGNGTTASGMYSNALGFSSSAVGSYSFAEGFVNIASGTSSVAMGTQVTASGDGSVAIGHNISTNGKTGSFFFADSDPYNRGTRVIGRPDQMACRFNGGYYFNSNNSGADIGVQVVAGSNSWSVISDVRLKEKFLPIDGEDFLQKIARQPLTTWNYKGQDVHRFRHYGHMAQDFYASFGKDGLGTIGCDTLINQQDLIGVNLVAIQALETRTARLKEENSSLKDEVAGLKSEVAEMRKMMTKMKKAVDRSL